MGYLTNFINNIKALFTNDVNIRVEKLEDDIKDINGQALYELRSEIYRIFGCMGFDMCSNHYDGTIERIKKLEDYLNTLTKHNVFKDIQYPLNKRIKELEKRIKEVGEFAYKKDLNFYKEWRICYERELYQQEREDINK